MTVPVEHSASNFHVVDIAIFALILIVSTGIGLYHAFTGGKQKTIQEYFMANHSLRTIPVALSILVSFVSAILVLGTPAEMYTRGTQLSVRVLGYCISCVLSSLLLVPLMYPLKITSSFEYLERRYKSRSVKLMGSLMMIIGNLFYMGLLMYTPSTALEAVTPFPFWSTVIVTGCVSTAYTTLGGMKAVIWTDVFQAVVMIGGMLAIVVQGTVMVGGLGKVLEVSQEGGRLLFFNFDPDPTQRLSFWSLVIGGTFSTLTIFGIGQSSVQRYSALPTLKQAKRSIYLNIPGLVIVNVLASLVGLVVYAYYASKGCDPLKQGYISNANQIVPYFVIDVLNYPGVPGLFLAVLFSGSLSSMSSSLNGVAAVTWEDLCKPFMGHWKEKHKMVVTKLLVVMYGISAIAVAFATESLGVHVLQASLSFTGATTGPSLGMFMLGAFFRVGNSVGAVSGCVVATAFNLWLAIGTFITKPYSRTILPTTAENCHSNASLFLAHHPVNGVHSERPRGDVGFAQNSSSFLSNLLNNGTWGSNFSSSNHYSGVDGDVTHIYDVTSLGPQLEPANELSGLSKLYGISFLWYSFIGCFISVAVGLIVSIITDKYCGQGCEEELLVPFRKRMSACLPKCLRHRKYAVALHDESAESAKPQKFESRRDGFNATRFNTSESKVPLTQESSPETGV